MSSVCRVAATSCARNTRAPSQALTAVAASVPVSRSSSGTSRVSPTKSLFDSATSTGQPVATSSSSRRVASSECRVFLPKSWPGVDQHALAVHPGGDGGLGERRRPLHDVGDDVVVGDPVRTGARRQAAGVGADDPGPRLGGHRRQLRVHAAPGVVDDVRAGGQRLAGDRGPPGVDRDRQRRVRGADRGDQVDGAADLLGGVDVLARARP